LFAKLLFLRQLEQKKTVFIMENCTKKPSVFDSVFQTVYVFRIKYFFVLLQAK